MISSLLKKRSWLLMSVGFVCAISLSITAYAVLLDRGFLGHVRSVCLRQQLPSVCFSLANTLSTKKATTIATSPDGKLLASGYGKKILVWNLNTNRRVATLVGHTGWVSAIRFSPDQTLASGSLDGTIRLWNLATGKFSSFKAGRITTLAFSPDGQILAGGSRNSLWFDGQRGIGGVQLWELKTEKSLPVLGTDSVGSLAFSPNGQILAAGSSTTQLWELKTGQLLHNLDSGQVTNLAFNPNGQTLVSGSSKIKIWNVNTGNLIYLLKSGSSDLALSSDGLMAVASGGMIDLWQLETGKFLGELRGSRYSNQHVTFGFNGQTMINGSSEGIKIWRSH